MRRSKKAWLIWTFILLLIFGSTAMTDLYASQPVTVLLNEEEQKQYTTIHIGDRIELEAFIDQEEDPAIHWSSSDPQIADIHDNGDTVLLEAKEIGSAVIRASVLTGDGEYARDLLVYTRTDPEQMVYIEYEREADLSDAQGLKMKTAPKEDTEKDQETESEMETGSESEMETESEKLTEHESETESENETETGDILKPRAAGDITLTIDGEERKSYTTIALDETKAAKVSVEGETIEKVVWSSSDRQIVTISGDKDGAKISAVSVGVATITAEITTDQGKSYKDLMITTRTPLDIMGYANEDTEMHQAANEQSNVNRDVKKGDTVKVQGQSGRYYWVSYDDATGFVLKSKVNITAAGLVLDKEYVTIKKNAQETMRAEVSPSQYTGTVSWSSSKADIATVNSNGKVTGVKEGTAKIYASAEGINGNLRVSGTVSVWTELGSIAAVTSKAVNGKKGAVSDSAADGSIGKGVAVTVVGQCGNYYYIRLANGSRVFVEKNAVTIAAVSISLNTKSVTVNAGKTYQLTAKILPEQATDKNVVWSSSNTSIAKVNSNGKVSGGKKGTATIQAKTSNGKLVAECKVKVKETQISDAPPAKKLELIKVTGLYNAANVTLRIQGVQSSGIKVQISFFEANKSGASKTVRHMVSGNGQFTYRVGGLDKKYYQVRVRIFYSENGAQKNNISDKLGVYLLNPTVGLQMKKLTKKKVNIKMTLPPSSVYKSFVIKSKVMGVDKDYKKLSKNKYKIKGNQLSITLNMNSGRLIYFEVSLFKGKTLVCKNSIPVRAGYVTVRLEDSKYLNKITVNWGAMKSAAGYFVYRSEKKGNIGRQIANIKNGNTNKYVDKTENHKNRKKYYYKVTPYWKEGRTTLTGSSNQPGILSRKMDTKKNYKKIYKKKLNGMAATDGQKINKYYIKSKKGVKYYPAIKYEFDGKKLTFHLYIDYTSYTYKLKSANDDTMIYTKRSTADVLKKTRQNGNDTYVDLFEAGLNKYLNNKVIIGKKHDFGKNVNFRTAVVIHRKNEKKAKYHSKQQFIEVMIGGIDKYNYSKKSELDNDDAPYWYHARYEDQQIFMPEDGQVQNNTKTSKQNYKHAYSEVAMHEMGHILGLGDAYPDRDNKIDRCAENSETCVFVRRVYKNMMKSNNAEFTPNDFEMMLRAYKKSGNGKVKQQYYKSYSKKKISKVIGNTTDNHVEVFN